MFIQMLNPNQQSVFLYLAYKVAHADGVFAPEEKIRLQDLHDQMPGVEVVEADIKNLASIFTTKQAKVAMLLELAGIAMADEDIANEEKQLLKEIATALAIDLGGLNDIMSWVSRAFYLFREAQSFMEE